MAGNQPNSKDEVQAFSKLTTVMAIDLCEFSSLMEQSEDRAIQAVHILQGLIVDTASKYNGRLFHSAGDGFLVEFRTTKEAFSAAQEILEKRRSYKVRIGLHVGEVSVQADGDLLGHTVNVAARLQQAAKPDTIMLSAQSFNIATETDNSFALSEREIALKNIDETYTVRELSRRTILKRRYKKRSHFLMKAVGLTILLVACSWLGFEKFSSQKIEAERRATLTAVLDKYDQRNELDRYYLAQLFFDLEQSRTPIGELTITLLETNKVSEAIASLKRTAESLTSDDPRYIKTLHYIGALSYQTDPHQSISAYKAILNINSNDLQAKIRLGRAHDFIGEYAQALDLYEQAYQASEDTQTRFWLQLDMAYNHLIMGKHPAALDIYNELFEEIGKAIDENSQLSSKLHTDIAVAYQRVGDHPQAVISAQIALLLQKRNGHFHELARSHSLMGYLILNDPASNSDDPSRFEDAIWHYSEQMRYDKQMNNLRGVSLAHYSLGSIYEMQESWKIAREHYNQALLNATPSIEFLTYIGFASLEKQVGEIETSCQKLKKAHNISRTTLEAKIGPETREKIRSFNCGFSFF